MRSNAIYQNTLARLSRRQLLNAAVILGTAAIAPPLFSRKTLAAPIFMDYPFQLGVASGDPAPDGFVLWTRLAPRPFESGYFTAYRGIANENFDFIIHTGDYIYEGRDNGNRTPDTVVRRHKGQEIHTVVDYRNRYAQYKSDSNLQAAHASAPWLMTRDDHEVENNYTVIDENDIPPEIFALRKAMAYQAYYETMPLRSTALPQGSTQLLYRRVRFGDLMDISLLDTRQYRSDQPCGDGSRTGCAAIDDPNATMLGAEQEQWLFANLATVKSTWTLLSQQVPIFMRDNLKATPDAQFSMDKWDAYTVARQRLMHRLRETQAANPVVLSGDVHMAYAAELKMDYRNPDSETVAVEFTGTSVSSGGDGTDVSAGWDTVKGDNPHIKYHSARRGYTAFVTTAGEMRAEYKIVDKVTVLNQPMRLAATVVATAGKPGVEVVAADARS